MYYIFSNTCVQCLSKLVKEPLVKYNDVIVKLQNHKKNKYHLFAAQKTNNFLRNMENGFKNSVDILHDNHKQQIIDYNHK